MNTNHVRVLEELGLTTSESKVYLSILELSEPKIVSITSKTQLHRRTVYDAIERLVEKGLISYIKEENSKLYKVTNPNNLKKLLQIKEDDLENIMPELEVIHKTNKQKQQTTFFRGKQGLKSVFNHQLEIGKDICIIGASLKAHEILQFYFPHYDRTRVEENIKARIIFYEQDRDNEMIGKIPNAEIRFLPNEFSSPSATNIYGDNVSIVLWAKEEPNAILIENGDIANGYKNQFELLWKMAKK